MHSSFPVQPQSEEQFEQVSPFPGSQTLLPHALTQSPPWHSWFDAQYWIWLQ